MKQKISIVAPAYNEEKNISIFYQRLKNTLEDECKEYSWEIIFVNDGSKDGTYEELLKIAKKEKRVKILDLSRNFGHQAAMTAGLFASTGDIIISMDCDLQDPPELISEMIKRWEEGSQVVYARRTKRMDGFFKRNTAYIYYRLLGIFSDVDIPRNVGDYRLMDRAVLESLMQMDEKARYLRGMVAWLGYKHDFVDFERPERLHGKTEYTLRKMMRLGVDGVLNFSSFPLRIGFLIGFSTAMISFILLTYMTIDTLSNNTEYPLFKWLSVILFGFAGLQFIFLWIMGEYIGRIYDDVRKRPLYVTKEKINIDEE